MFLDMVRIVFLLVERKLRVGLIVNDDVVWMNISLMGSHFTVQMLQLAEYHESALVSAKPAKRPSMKERKQKLLAFLQGKLLCRKTIVI